MKIMVMGASGYLGNTVYKKLKLDVSNEVYGTCHTANNQELLKIDLMNKADISETLKYKPDVIIWCVMDSMAEMELSQIGLSEILSSIQSNVRFIYVSTTIGEGKEQTEEVIPRNRMVNEYLFNYINGKIEGEKIVRSHDNHVIVRPGSIYGYDFDGKMDGRMASLLKISKTCETYSRTANMFASFVQVQDLADAIIEITYSDFLGTINVAGEKPVSHYEFNKYLAKLLKIDEKFILPDYRNEAVYHTLNSNKSKQLLKTVIRNI